MAKSVLIIGASRGIGLGLADEFARRGWRVIATARDLARAPDLSNLAAASHGAIVVGTTDVTKLASLESLRKRLEGESLDALVVNAGMGNPRGKTTLSESDDEFQTLFLTNALGPIRAAELFADLVSPKTGVIGLMTSRLGSVEDANRGGAELYRASKAALNSFTRSFAARHKDKEFVVLSLHPGWVRTELGGPNAPVEVAESVHGLVDVIERARTEREDRFVDYRGETIPW